MNSELATKFVDTTKRLHQLRERILVLKAQPDWDESEAGVMNFMLVGIDNKLKELEQVCQETQGGGDVN